MDETSGLKVMPIAKGKVMSERRSEYRAAANNAAGLLVMNASG